MTKPIRDDLSTKLVHLTRDDGEKKGRDAFLQIIQEGKLKGGSGFIKGGHTCSCFTEAPVSKLAQILATPTANGFRYKILPEIRTQA